jgi:hypothetical protein
VHRLLRARFLESPGVFGARKIAPSFRVAKPLHAVLRICLGTLLAPQSHSAAIASVAHARSYLGSDIHTIFATKQWIQQVPTCAKRG